MEAGGVLIGGTAEETKEHIKRSWGRGGEAVQMVRERLGDDADRLVPLRKGEVRLLKILSTMNDCCETA